MGTVFDIIFAVILLGFVISGFKAGLIRSLVGLVSSLFAIVVAVALANRFSGLIGSWLFHGGTENVLQLALAKVIATVLFFVLLHILIRMVVGALDTVFRLPVLHQINMLFGGVFGLLKGVLVIFLLCAVLQLAAPAIAVKYPELSQKEIDRSCIYQIATANNPIYRLYQTEI
jgi:Uncharacterized membrane protein, required for colicin V production